jgi:hypothetical protein
MKFFKSLKWGEKSPGIEMAEYRLFTGQPESVLRAYRLARKSIAVAFPLFALLALYSPYIAAALALSAGIFLFFFLREKYGAKSAAAPLIAAISGVLSARCILAPLVERGRVLQEAVRGF